MHPALRNLLVAIAASGTLGFAGTASAQAVVQGGLSDLPPPVYGAPPPVYASPGVYIPPPPPPPQPNFAIGARFWVSQGKTSFNIDSSKLDPTLGSPTSTLTYDDIDAYTPEVTFFAANETDTFFKGFVGGGWLDGGSLDDEDYYADQVKFSDTYSELDGSSMVYGTIDIGQRFDLRTRGPQIQLNPFVGFNYWQETVDGYGARCNRDDVPDPDSNCAPAGSTAVSFNTKVITNESHWASLRLGAEMKMRFFDRLTLVGDAAFLPVAYLWNDDSHYLRQDLGSTPNIQDDGTGWGYQLEGSAQLDLTENWTLGGGVRYWYATTDGDSEFVHHHVKVDLDDFTSERFGVFGDVTYKFATF